MGRETTIRQFNDDDEFDDEFDDDAERQSDVVGGVPDSPTEPPAYDDELRPSRLNDVIGQSAVVERIRILLDAGPNSPGTAGPFVA